MLRRLQGQPQARASEEPRRQRVEALAARVAVGRRQLPEAEAGRRELDVDPGACERSGELVVVPRGERRWIGEQDAHAKERNCVLVRSWNLYHGNTVPVQARAFLDEMVALATADDPAVLCLQEVPAWALGRFTAGAVAARPMFGPLPITPEVGRRLTEPNHGRLRSAFAGQGNAMHVSPRLRVLSHHVLTLNSRRFRFAQSRALGLGAVARLGW